MFTRFQLTLIKFSQFQSIFVKFSQSRSALSRSYKTKTHGSLTDGKVGQNNTPKILSRLKYEIWSFTTKIETLVGGSLEIFDLA